MNVIVYSFIHSINHPTIQQTFIDSKCLFTRHFLSTKDAKINRGPMDMSLSKLQELVMDREVLQFMRLQRVRHD